MSSRNERKRHLYYFSGGATIKRGSGYSVDSNKRLLCVRGASRGVRKRGFEVGASFERVSIFALIIAIFEARPEIGGRR